MKWIACVVAGLVFVLGATGFAADEFEDARPALDKQIADYNRLLEEKRLPEAAAIAKAIQTQYPKHPITKLLQEHTRLLQVLSERGGDPRALRRAGELQSRVYSVADIIAPIPGNDDKAAVAEPTETDYQPLIKLIQETVAPLSWDEVNGPASMRPYCDTRSLVVRQTQAAHDEIATLLSQLRKLRCISINLEIRTLTLMRNSELWDAYGLENTNPTTLTTKQLAELIDQIPEKFRKYGLERETLLAGPKLTLANGQAGSVETPESRHFDALKLKIEPLAGSNSTLQLRISNEDAPESAVVVDLKSGENAAIDVTRLSKTPSTTVADVALRELYSRKAARTVLIITPTVSYGVEEAVEKR